MTSVKGYCQMIFKDVYIRNNNLFSRSVIFHLVMVKFNKTDISLHVITICKSLK